MTLASGSPLRGREAALAFAGGALLAVVMSWHVVLHLGSDVPGDLGDPLLQAWQVAWGGHALAEQPLDYFQSNTFWPLPDSLAFSDALVGYAPAGLIGEGSGAALVRYNLLYLFAYALAFAGAYLLGRELGLRPAAAVVAAIAFAYAPYRLSQVGHLHVLSSGGIPFALFLLLRGWRRGRPWTLAGGWLVAAWQLSLGFTLGLPLAYGLAVLVIVAGIGWVRGWDRRQQRARRIAVAGVAGALVFAGVGVALAQPYLRVIDDHPEAERTVEEVDSYSPPVWGFASAPEQSLVWGAATEPVRDTLKYPVEQSLFPGIAILALAALGVAGSRPRRLPTSPLPRTVRVGLTATAGVLAFLSLGLWPLDGWLGYRPLYELAPGWDALRTPGRLTTFTTLALAVLAGAGAQRLIAKAPRKTAVATVLAALVLLEGHAPLDHPTVPDPPPEQQRAADPVLHLPSNRSVDTRYMFWSSDGFPRIVNGHSGFEPRQLVALREELRTFPDERSSARLRALGVRTVLVHRPDGRIQVHAIAP